MNEALTTPRLGLAARLILLATLSSVLIVSVSFLVFALEVRRQSRRWILEAVSRQHERVQRIETRRVNELLRTSRLLTDSPTLRATLEVWRTEARTGQPPHPDLRRTMAHEALRVATMAEVDLLVITDERGRALAAVGPAAIDAMEQGDFARHEVVRRALRPDEPLGLGNLDVLQLGETHLRVGAVPIVLQGFVIGALVLGESIDARFVDDWKTMLAGDVILAKGRRVVGSSLAALQVPELPAAFDAVAAGAQTTSVIRVGDEEYVAAVMPLGPDGADRTARVYLLQSLTAAMAGTGRSLVRSSLWIGALAALIATVAAWRVSGTILRPFRRFVGFMRTVAASGDWSQRFHAGAATAEVTDLADACNGLITSLEQHQRSVERRAMEDLERMERLKESEKLAALGRMLSGAAHEINNPLTGLVGRIGMLLDGAADLPLPVRKRLQTAHRDGERVVALVRRLLNVAHRDDGDPQVVNVTEIVREVQGLRRHDLQSAGVQMSIEAPDDPAAVRISALELHQVFVNLVGNACDALAGRPGARLIVRVGGSPDEVRIEVEDNGPGIEQPGRVFEFFYTTKPVGKGTGLGLGICHTIVARAGGRMVAENRPAGGARFTVCLPRLSAEAIAQAAIDDERSRESAAPDPDPALGSKTLEGASILVVDDEWSVLELQIELLTGFGACVTGASLGAEAVQRLQEESFDVVVSDMQMPGQMSGKDLLQWIDTNRPELRSRFLFVTGGAIDDDGYLERCGVTYIPKPFTVEEYHRAIRDVLVRASANG